MQGDCFRMTALEWKRTMLSLCRAFLIAALCFGTAIGRGQEHAALPKVGELWMGTPETAAIYREAFHAGLRDLGYRDGTNMKLVTRYALGDMRRIPAMVEELIAEKVDVVYLIPAALPYAKQRASTIPIVSNVDDPVLEGYATSLARLDGNVTGSLVSDRIQNRISCLSCTSVSSTSAMSVSS